MTFFRSMVLVVFLAGCATPMERANQVAAGWQRAVLVGSPFRHLTFFKPGNDSARTLHVYIEHDGVPWVLGSEINADPTPRKLIMLELMRLDSASALYLGRPCYFSADPSPPCNPKHWTHERYSAEIVASMAAALERFLASHPFEHIHLFGLSGGGTIVTLLAERFPQTRAVVTLGANLDVDAWADLHGYSRLQGSLNPIERPPLPGNLSQRHYVGKQDRNVPPSLLQIYQHSHPNAVIIELEHVDHECCWTALWPNILASRAKPLLRRP